MYVAELNRETNSLKVADHVGWEPVARANEEVGSQEPDGVMYPMGWGREFSNVGEERYDIYI